MRFLRCRLLESFCLILVLLAGTNGRLEAQQRPNILWVTIEDLSPHLGSYGDPVAQTPTLDRLASEGVRFTNAFSTAAVCAPSRSAIITGMYQTSIGTHHMRTTHVGPGLPTPYEAVPPPYVKTFTEYLRGAGYYCTNNVKTDYQFATPATAWDESSNTAHWRNRPDPSQPFFSVFNFTTTHESANWPDPKHTDPATVPVPPYYPDTLPVRNSIARLYDNVAMVDGQIGEILRQLDEDGLTGNTIVFFMSDHGDGLPRAKRWLYDSGLHVPMIVRWPGMINPGTVDEELVSLVDLAPTVLSLAGVDLPVHLQGQAFLGPRKSAPRDYIFAARDRFDESYDMVRAVRDGQFKYIQNYYPLQPYVLWIPYRNQSPIMQELLRLYAEDGLEGPQRNWFNYPRPAEELYDTQADPFELNNLAANPEYEDHLNRLRQALDSWREESKDMGDISEEVMIAHIWPGGVQPVTARPIILPHHAMQVSDAGVPPGGSFDEPVTIQIHCPTQGASIAYTTESVEPVHWLLYSGPITFKEGVTTLRAKAIRYGYKESDEVSATFTITTP